MKRFWCFSCELSEMKNHQHIPSSGDILSFSFWHLSSELSCGSFISALFYRGVNCGCDAAHCTREQNDK